MRFVTGQTLLLLLLLLLLGLCLPALAETSYTTRTTTQTSTQGNQTHTQTYTRTTTRTSGQTHPSFVRPAAQPAADPISKLVQQLDGDASGLWINGLFPTIRLPATASATAVLTQAIKLTGFSQGHIKSWKLLTVRQVRFRSQPRSLYSAALIDSDLGRKILLFRFDSPGTGWWSRFYPAGQP